MTGYHTGIEMKKALEMGIEIMVAIPATSSNAPDKNYNISHLLMMNQLIRIPALKDKH